MPTPTLATCSTVCLHGRHALSVLCHGQRVSHLSAARLLVPCSSITRARGSCSLPPRSPSPPSLSGAGACACAPERGHHECRRRARCRCYCLHSIPPPSEPSAVSSSPHRAAPLDLLDRRLWPLLLPTVGTAAVAAAATVAAPPQAASGHAGQPSVCVRPPWSSPPRHRRCRRPRPAGATSPAILCSVFRPGTLRKNLKKGRVLSAMS